MTLSLVDQGQGVIAEAFATVTGQLMSERGAHRIVMQGDARNAAVLVLMRRLGCATRD